MSSTSSTLALAALLPPVALSLPTCGGGGGGGGGVSLAAVVELEPNNNSGQANSLILGRTVKGDVREPLDTDADGTPDLSDEDWFIVRLTGNRSVKIEIFGTRRDQAGWNAVGTVPRVTVFFPFGFTKIVDNSLNNGWTFGALDLDVPLFRVPFTGFYWIAVRPDVPDVPPGDPPNVSAGGNYYLRVSYTTPTLVQLEGEANLDTGVNDTAGTAQVITPGTLTGFHREGNDDFYSIAVAGPRVLRAEIVAQRNGISQVETDPFDPLLRLYDVDGTTVLAENDDAFFADPAIQHEVAAAGTYFLQVTQSGAVSGDSPYVLTLSSDSAAATAETEPNNDFGAADPLAYNQSVSGTIAPGEQDWFRFSGTAGDMVRLQVFDAANSESATAPVDVALFAVDGSTPVLFDKGPQFQVLTTILQQTGVHYVRVAPDPTTPAATSYRLELRRFQTATYESEPNGAIGIADVFPGNGAVAGAISVPGDLDVYRFTTATGDLAVFDVFAGSTATGSNGFPEYSGHGSDLAPLLTIRDSTGAVLATSTSLPAGSIYTESVLDGLPTAAVALVGPPTSHVFYLEVAAADGTGGSAHTYVVRRR